MPRSSLEAAIKTGGGNNNVHMTAPINYDYNPIAGLKRESDVHTVGQAGIAEVDVDSEEDERDKQFAPPPSYFKNFELSKNAMAVPDLDSLSKKDYFIMYQ